jgi:hypothetical protein
VINERKDGGRKEFIAEDEPSADISELLRAA